MWSHYVYIIVYKTIHEQDMVCNRKRIVTSNSKVLGLGFILEVDLYLKGNILWDVKQIWETKLGAQL